MKLEQTKGIWHPPGAKKAWQRYWHRAPDMAAALEFCRGRRTVIQAGGNIGAWAIWLARKFDKVMTFEPEPANYKCLVQNARPYPNILPFYAALSDESGHYRLNISASIGSHHLTEERGDTQVWTIDQHGVDECDLIVLDIEGYELPALRGAINTIQRSHPVIMIECRGHGVKKGRGDTYADVDTFLTGMGYELRKSVRHDEIWVYRG